MTTRLKPGDRVMIPATVSESIGDDAHYVRMPDGTCKLLLDCDLVRDETERPGPLCGPLPSHD